MSKNEELNALFMQWRTALGPEGIKFIADGIIHEHSYLVASTRILFLGKEAHEKGGGGWDFRDEWAKDPGWLHAEQAKRWAYGILNDFPPWEDAVRPPENALMHVACMNIKKTGGGSSSVYDDIAHHASTHAEYIRKQVSIIDPDIIIGGLRGYDLWSTIVGEQVTMEVIEGIGVFRWGNAKALDFFHPSNRYPHSMSYALLSRVVGSEKFENL